MPINRDRQRVLRAEALGIVWQVLDEAHTSIDLSRDGLTDEEVIFISKIIDQKAQLAFVEFEKFKERNALPK